MSRLVTNGTLEYISNREYFSKFNGWGLASVQADVFKRRPTLKWSAAYHYYSPDDNPPTYCPGVNGWNKTNERNILKGIKRFTSLLVAEKGGTFSALMLLHILQDVTLGPHLCGKARGGNDVTVEYNGRFHVLHKLWDSTLVQELADRAGGTDALIKEIVDAAEPRFGAARSLTDGSWMDDVVAKANEVHQLNCKIVWRDELRTPDVLLPVMHGLLVEAARFSACHWDWLAAAAQARRMEDQRKDQGDEGVSDVVHLRVQG